MEKFIQDNVWLVILFATWTIIWKGFALWKAALLNDKVWFWILLIVNTVGILEIAYIYYFSNQKGAISEKKV